MRAGYRVSSRHYEERFPAKHAAHIAFRAAVVAGKVKRKPCEVCGSERRINGHHPDYLKPLDVIWLCMRHHKAWHREHGPGLNGGEAPLLRVPQAREWTGERIGMLRVVSRVGSAALVHEQKWACVCDCGAEAVRTSEGLSSAQNRSQFCACRDCLKRAKDMLSVGNKAQRFAVMKMFGLGLYGEATLTEMHSDIRHEISLALGVPEPRAPLNDVSFTCSDAGGFGSATVAELLDSPELWTAKTKQSIREQGQQFGKRAGAASARRRAARKAA